MSRKIAVNIAVIYAVILSAAVPLTAGSTAMLQASEVQTLTALSFMRTSALTTLSPFLLGVVPFIQAAIFIQIVNGLGLWSTLRFLPASYRMSREESSTAEGGRRVSSYPHVAAVCTMSTHWLLCMSGNPAF